MKLSKYGVSLKKLREEDIELVRNWRNSKRIIQFMEYREYITPEMQKKWFHSIDNFNNLYFIIEYNNERIGLVNDKNIDWQAKTSESGIFISEPKYNNTYVPLLVSMCGIETWFYIAGWHKQYSRMLKTNTRAVKFNKMLGYELCEGQENIENQLYILTKENFNKKAKRLQKAVRIIAGTDIMTTIKFDEYDYKIGLAQKFENFFKNMPVKLKYKKIKTGKLFYINM